MVPSSWFLLFVAGFFWTCPLGASDVDLETQEKAEAHNAEGVKLAGERRYREAVRAFSQAIVLSLDYEVAYYNLGLAHSRLEDYSSAAAAFGAAVQIRPDYGAAWYQLGVALQADGRMEAATKVYLMALPFMPDSPNLRYRLGLAFLRQQNWAQVAVHWEDLITNHPDHPETLKMQRDLPLVYYNLGLVHQQAGRLDKAIEAYEKTIQIRPDYADAYQNLALIYREQGKFDEAVRAHQEVVASRPDDLAALTALARTYVLQDSSSRAIEVYQKVLAVEETRADVRRGLVAAMIKNGDMAGALQETNRILKAVPKDSKSYALLAFLLEHNAQGIRYGPEFQSQEAVKTYQMVLKMDPKNVRHHYNLGILYGRMGLWQESLEALLKAREIDSTHAGVQKWLPEVERRAKGEPFFLEIEQKK